ncbi:MAG: SRPBCC domain-containing protein [Bacteroidetes bacterium]|nr:SRPBCC domain-containing protein [Bacteroidota bacterium]
MITASNTDEREIVLSRTLNAPRELVWEAWTNPEHVKIWWGPDGFTNTFHEFELKPGGVWRFIMHGPDGTDYPNKIVFTKVEKPSRLEYRQGSDEDNAGMFEAIILFTEKDGKTELTMRSIFKTKEARDFVVEKYGAVEGGKQHLRRLENYLQKMA